MAKPPPVSAERLAALVDALQNAPESFSAEMARETTLLLVSTKTETDQLAKGFMLGLKSGGLEEKPQIVAACAAALRTAAVPVALPPQRHPLVDIVGTGGDGQDTFNVSTASAIVAASCGGLRVAKHGNRASSSACGSADFVEALGSRLDAVTSETAGALLDDCGFAFLFAQQFHPSMRRVSAPRRELRVRTVFNILGPLINPACPTHMVVGVCDASLGPAMADALAHVAHVERALVVHGAVRLDEIAPTGETLVWEVVRGQPVRSYALELARDFGLAEHPLEAVRGRETAADTAACFRALLNAPTAPQHAALVDYILANTAALLYVGGRASSLRDGVSLARQALDSGSALRLLNRYVSLTG